MSVVRSSGSVRLSMEAYLFLRSNRRYGESVNDVVTKLFLVVRRLQEGRIAFAKEVAGGFTMPPNAIYLDDEAAIGG